METLTLSQYATVETLETTPSLSTLTNSVKQSLDELFPEQKYEDKNLQSANEILGDLATQFTKEQIKDVISEIQYLTDCWLDDFERSIFGGLILKEVLHEKGGS